MDTLPGIAIKYNVTVSNLGVLALLLLVTPQLQHCTCLPVKVALPNTLARTLNCTPLQ